MHLTVARLMHSHANSWTGRSPSLCVCCKVHAFPLPSKQLVSNVESTSRTDDCGKGTCTSMQTVRLVHRDRSPSLLRVYRTVARFMHFLFRAHSWSRTPSPPRVHMTVAKGHALPCIQIDWFTESTSRTHDCCKGDALPCKQLDWNTKST